MPEILEDNNFVVATVHGPARRSAPFPNINALYVLEQDYMQNEDNFTPLDLNTAHATLGSYKLVSEGQPKVEGGVREWTRTYAQVPASWSEPGGTYSYRFIGFSNSQTVNIGSETTVTGAVGRDPFSKTVDVRIQRDYFLVGTGGTYATAEAIPAIEALRYYVLYSGEKFDVEYLRDNPPWSTQSSPTRAAYDALRASGGEIAVEPSTKTRWMGNIWCRETRYVVAL